MRPIVSAIGSPTYSLAKFVTTITSPLDEQKPLSTAKIPYIERLSEKISTILREFRIRTVLGTIDNLGRILTRVKDPTPPR